MKGKEEVGEMDGDSDVLRPYTYTLYAYTQRPTPYHTNTHSH